MKFIIYILITITLAYTSSAQLKLIHPNGGETLQAGFETRVLWEGVSDSANVAIKFSSDGGENWSKINNLPNWKTPYINSDSCKIYIRYLTNSDIVYSKTLGGKGHDSGGSMSETMDGGFIVAGHSSSNDIISNQGKKDIIIFKLNKDLETEWFKSYGGSGDEFCNTIKQTKDKGFIISGNSKSSDGNIGSNRGYADIYILKLDSLGDIEWSKTFGGSDSESANYIIQNRDGSYILVGWTESTDGDFSSNNGLVDLFFLKLNSNGDLIWLKTFGGEEEDIANSVIQTQDDGLLIIGTTNTNDNIISNKGKFDALILKIKPNGEIAWSRNYGGNKSDDIESVVITDNDCYMIAGTSYSNNEDLKKNQGLSDFWILKIDSQGSIIWSKTFGGSGRDEAASIISNDDGTYSFIGITGSDDGDIINSNGGGDYCIFNIDSNGNINWSQTFGGSGIDLVNSICRTVGGDYLLSGYTLSTDGDINESKGGNDLWLVSVNNESKVYLADTSNSFFSIVNPTSSIKDNNNNINFTVSPNIVSNTATATIKLTVNGETTLELYDSQGRKLGTLLSGFQSKGQRDIQIDVSQYPSGRYFLKLTTPNISKTEILEVQR